MDRDSAIELLALNLFEEDEDKDVEDLLDIIENEHQSTITYERDDIPVIKKVGLEEAVKKRPIVVVKVKLKNR